MRYLLAVEAVLLALLAWSLARHSAGLGAWLALAGVLLVQAAALGYWWPRPGQRPRRTALTDLARAGAVGMLVALVLSAWLGWLSHPVVACRPGTCGPPLVGGPPAGKDPPFGQGR